MSIVRGSQLKYSEKSVVIIYEWTPFLTWYPLTTSFMEWQRKKRITTRTRVSAALVFRFSRTPRVCLKRREGRKKKI